MPEKCPCCGDELFQVFFGSDRMFTDVDMMRCWNCNQVFPFKKQNNEQETKKE